MPLINPAGINPYPYHTLIESSAGIINTKMFTFFYQSICLMRSSAGTSKTVTSFTPGFSMTT